MNDTEAVDVLETLHQEVLFKFIPVIVILAVTCVMGIAGNAFTICFYGAVATKTPSVFLITVLASVDLAVCVLMIPNMVEMGFNVKYTNAAACKIMHFLGHLTIMTSALILWFIAIDRYRHVCCPFKKQLTFQIARRVVITLSVVSFLFSIRDFANFDIIEFSVPKEGINESEVLGHYCTTTDDPDFKLSVTLFHSIDAVLFVVILVTLFFSYGKIIWTIKNGGFVAAAADSKEKQHALSKTSDFESQTETCNSDTISCEQKKSQMCEATVSVKADKSGNKKQREKKKKSTSSKIKKTERSITFMMLIVSFIFCLCFLPYFTIKIGIRSYTSASQLELGAIIQLGIRLSYINSFANPYIFCLFNPQFRRFIRRTIQRVKPFATDHGTVDTTVVSSLGSV